MVCEIAVGSEDMNVLNEETTSSTLSIILLKGCIPDLYVFMTMMPL